MAILEPEAARTRVCAVPWPRWKRDVDVPRDIVIPVVVTTASLAKEARRRYMLGDD